MGGFRIFSGYRPMPTNVYIDGFNLYYGLKNRWPEYKWLDIQSFCQSLLPQHHLNRIRYFTARVQNPRPAQNQRAYLRALETLPKVVNHYGYFASRDVQMPLSNPPASEPSLVSVRRSEEKQSDVNLATYLLLDCFRNDCTEAAIITNDSDLATPIQVVRDELKVRVGIINPQHRKFRSTLLSQAASWKFQDINRRHFRDNQFPPTITDAAGTFSKPSGW